MSSPPTVRAELALAIRIVNVAFDKLTLDQQDVVEIVADTVLDAALLDGDRDRALEAIADWRDQQLRVIGEVQA